MAVDFILKIEGVRGESKKKEEEPPIEIDAFSYELSSHSGALQTRTRGRRYTDITFKKRLDKSSIAIQQMLIQNAKINKVTFTAIKTGGK